VDWKGIDLYQHYFRQAERKKNLHDSQFPGRDLNTEYETEMATTRLRRSLLLQMFNLKTAAPYSLRALMMEALRTSETSVTIYTTRRNIPEENNLHINRRKNLKSHAILTW
jgi:hypothetical protein